MTNIFYCTSRDMKLVPDNMKGWLDYLLSVDKRKLVVSIEQEKTRRTLQSNAYLWGLVYKTIANETGHSENEIHEIYKRLMLPAKFIKFDGKEIRLPGTTTDLSKGEFSEYVERIKAHAGNMGITIPEPIESIL
jgi:hypothetical protein